jgi:predicted nucleic acid-binding protein
MKHFFDTSALVPVFLEDHKHHEPSLKLFLTANKKQSCCAAHTLADIYSVVTRLPGKHRLSGDQALLFLEEVSARLSLVSLSGEEYYLAAKAAAERGIVGGTFYDALLVFCAQKAEADLIFTWNSKHFQQFGPDISRRLRTP